MKRIEFLKTVIAAPLAFIGALLGRKIDSGQFAGMSKKVKEAANAMNNMADSVNNATVKMRCFSDVGAFEVDGAIHSDWIPLDNYKKITISGGDKVIEFEAADVSFGNHHIGNNISGKILS